MTGAGIAVADARFLLPDVPATAAVLGVDGWADALAIAGIEVGARPDLVVTDVAHLDEAIETGAPMVLVEGDAVARLRRAGYRPGRYFAMPAGGRPSAFVPARDIVAARWWLSTATATGWRRAARVVAAAASAAGVTPPRARPITVGSRAGRPPRVVAAAVERGLVDGACHHLVLRSVDDIDKRVVVRVEDSRGGVVVKPARVRGARAASDRDAAGLALVSSLGPPATRHAPRSIDRFDIAGLDALVESSAPGIPIEVVLRAPRRRRSRRAIIDSVAGWLVEVAATTRTDATDRRVCMAELARDASAPWTGFGAPPDLFDRVGAVPGALQHRDLWTGNVLAHRRSFTVVDWELARRAWNPVTDLVMFLTDALAALDGARSSGERLEHFVALFGGRLDASRVLFGYLGALARACDLDDRTLGALVTIALLESGIPPWYERHLLPVDEMPLRVRFARSWLDHPGLGPSWPAFSSG